VVFAVSAEIIWVMCSILLYVLWFLSILCYFLQIFILYLCRVHKVIKINKIYEKILAIQIGMC